MAYFGGFGGYGSGFPMMGGGMGFAGHPMFGGGGQLVLVQGGGGQQLVLVNDGGGGGGGGLMPGGGGFYIMDDSESYSSNHGGGDMPSCRSSRLSNGQTRTLYHQTDAGSGAEIMRTGQMKRGSAGLAGGGIYFASCKSATDGKAQRLGTYLEATVKLGRVKRVGASGDNSLSFQRLQQEGFDSVEVDRPGGAEYVVYNHDQVTGIQYA